MSNKGPLLSMLKENATKYHGKSAIVYGNQRLYYGEFYERVLQFGQVLIDFDIQPTNCVLVLLPNCPEFLVSFYAIASIGAIMLPLSQHLKETEISSYILGIDIRAIITDSRCVNICRRIAAKAQHAIKIIVVGNVEDETENFKMLLSQSSCRVAEKSKTDSISADMDVLYQYSSGSTGQAKRVSRTQFNLFAEAESFFHTVQIRATDTILCLVPLFHAYGFGNGVLAPVRAGATLVLLESADSQGNTSEPPISSRIPRILELIEREKVTILPAVPHIYHELSLSSLSSPSIFKSLRCCFSAGNFLAPEIFEAFLKATGIPIRQQYGCTEAGAVAVNMTRTVNAVLVGKPLQGLEIKVVNEAGESVLNTVGEVIIKGASLTCGYQNAPDLSTKVFRDGFYFSGDLGIIDQNDNLTLQGRKTDFIDTGGYKVDPAEVEQVLGTHPSVKEVVVLGVAREYGNEIIKAVVVPREESQVDPDTLLAYCRTHLADFKVPHLIEFRSELPRSSLGKLLKKDLLDAVSHTPTVVLSIRSFICSGITHEHRQYFMEEYLTKQLSSLFHIRKDDIDIERPLGDYGLDSISLFELRSRIERDLVLSFAPTLVWNYPTTKALAGYLLEVLEQDMHHKNG